MTTPFTGLSLRQPQIPEARLGTAEMLVRRGRSHRQLTDPAGQGAVSLAEKRAAVTVALHLSAGLRAGLAVATALWLVCAGPAVAQEAAQLTTCLDSSDTRDRDMECRDLIFDACLDRTGDDSTVGMAECLGQEQKAWDAHLDDLWPQVRELAEVQADGTGEAPPALVEAQRRWIAYRDAECTWEMRRQGGSIRTILVAACMRDMTAERVADFRDWIRTSAPE